MWMYGVAVFCLLTLNSRYAEAVCTFPSSLAGVWHGSDFGQAVFSSTKFDLTNNLMKVDSNTFIMSQFHVVTFNCEQQVGNLVYLKSDEFTQYFANFRISMCWNLLSVSSTKIVYNSAMSVLLNTTNARFLLKSASSSFSMATDCIINGPYDASSIRVLVKDGYISSAKITCPSSLLGTFTYEFDSGSGNQCYSDSSMESCSDQSSLNFNYTLCSAAQAYSSEGQLYCVYSVSTGSTTYVTVYNTDSSIPDELTTFRFACYAIYNVTATQYPQACMHNQNETAVVSPGAVITLTRLSSCPVVTTENVLSAATVVSICVVLLLLIGGLTIVFYCWKKKKQMKKVRPEDDPLEVKAPPVDHFDRVGSSMSRCGAISPYSPYPTLSEVAVFRFGPSPIPDCDGGTTLGGTIAPGLPEEEIAKALQQRYDYEMEFESDSNTCEPLRPITQGDPDNISLPMYSENGITTPEPTRIREVFQQLETTARDNELDNSFPNEKDIASDNEKIITGGYEIEPIKQNGVTAVNDSEPKDSFIYSKNEDITIVGEDDNKLISDTTNIEDDNMPIVDKDFNQ